MTNCNGCTDMTQFWRERLAAAMQLAIAYETAIEQLTLNTISSYTLDTGQTQQTVTRANIYSLKLALEGVYNRIATLNAKLCGGTVIVRPGF